MLILCTEAYGEIINCIRNFRGLTVECLHYLHAQYPHMPPRTLWSILSWEHRERYDSNLQDMQKDAQELVLEYDRRIEDNPTCDFALTVMATQRRYAPYTLSRTFLQTKLALKDTKVNGMMYNPMRIQDEMLRKNVIKCIELDIMEGPVADEYREKIGVFFEEMLYNMLARAGIKFNTEQQLRCMGFRKTPDAKLLTKCYYRGQRIFWIESKAFFGNTFNHNKVMQRQLIPYTKEFGAGIVIYWMGFVDEIIDRSERSIHVRFDFPGPQELHVKNVIRRGFHRT